MLHDLREAIRTISADVVFLQEVLGDHREHQTRHEQWPEESQYEFLADTIWDNFAYGRNAVYPAGHHGNALLSKLPILRYENRDVSLSNSERRGLLHAVLDVPGRTTELHAICVHLSLGEQQRAKQAHMICEHVRSEVPDDATLVVAGDFNDWRGRIHGPLSKIGLREVFLDSAGRAAKSFPARWPLLRLDRIYIRHAHATNPTVLSSRPWSHLSDHAALTVDIAIR